MSFKLTKEENLERIYRAYAKDVYHACLYLAKDKDLAEEMTQQAFLNFYEKAADVKPECERAYLIQAAKNLTLNYFRHKKFEVYNKEEDDAGILHNIPTPSLEDKYLEKEIKEAKKMFSKEILAAVKAHNEEWYHILYSMFCLEKDHDDIADELGITKDVLYSRLYRAKHWIRKKYEKQFSEVEDGA